MAETQEKTPEEKLLEDAKKGGGAAAGDEGEGEGGDERTPEQKLIEELKETAKSSKERAEKAEFERDQERAQKDTARKAASTEAEKNVLAQEDSLKSKLSAAKSGFESAQKEWDDAYDAGDKAKLRAAQEKLNDAQMMLRGAEFNMKRFDDWKEESKKSVAATADLYDFKTGTGDTLKLPKSAIDWAKKHPKLSTDREYTDAVYDADGRAKRRGIEPYTPEYYEFLDGHIKRMGLTEEEDGEVDPPKKDEKEEKTPPKKESKSNASSSAAPVGGSTGSNGAGSGKQTFRMTADHRKAAQISFPDEYKKDPKATEEKYARIQLDIQERRKRGENI